MSTFTHTTKMYTTSCCSCGLQFSIPDAFDDELRRNGKSFYCPGCRCSMSYGKSEADKLRDQLEMANRDTARHAARADRLRDEVETAERQRRGQKAAKTRVMNRIKRGECPCCGKVFKDLHRHMNDQHPDYANQD